MSDLEGSAPVRTGKIENDLTISELNLSDAFEIKFSEIIKNIENTLRTNNFDFFILVLKLKIKLLFLIFFRNTEEKYEMENANNMRIPPLEPQNNAAEMHEIIPTTSKTLNNNLFFSL